MTRNDGAKKGASGRRLGAKGFSLLVLASVLGAIGVSPTAMAAPTDLGLMVGGTWSAAMNANDEGWIVGVGDSAGVVDCPQKLFRWSEVDGMTDLGFEVEGCGSGMVLVNNNGQIAWRGGDTQMAMFWSETTGPLSITLATSWPPDYASLPLNDLSSLAGLNEQGWVAGTAFPCGSSRSYPAYPHAFLWKDADDIIDLGALTPPEPQYSFLGYSEACAVNDQGQVIGFSLVRIPVTGYELHAFLWQEGAVWGPAWNPEMLDLGSPSDGLPECAAGGVQWDGSREMNNRGYATGTAAGPSGETEAVVLSPNPPVGWRDLPKLLPNTWHTADAINDVGQILGHACTTNPFDFDSYGDTCQPVLWNPTSDDTWAVLDLGLPEAALDFCTGWFLNNQGAVVAECSGGFTYPGRANHPYLWTPAAGWSDLGTLVPTGWPDGSGNRRDQALTAGINEFSQVVGHSTSAAAPYGEFPDRAVRWDSPVPDVDLDGMDNAFEAGFGGNLRVINSETGDSATGSGSAEGGAVIGSSAFTVRFPPGTSVAVDAPQIELVFVGGYGFYGAVVRGADLAGGTKSMVMPFILTQSPSLCIEDAKDAVLRSQAWNGNCLGIRVRIPRQMGESVTVNGYTVTRLVSTEALVQVDGLRHTALTTYSDLDDDGVQDETDLCPDVPGPADNHGCPTEEPNVPPAVAITGPPSGFLVSVGTIVTFTGTFVDQNTEDTHTAMWTIDSISIPGAVEELGGSGTVEGVHAFIASGVYRVTLTVTDDRGASGFADTVEGLDAFVVVYDPNGGFATGGGWINSPPGAYLPSPTLTGKATFGFVAKYQKGASTPTGQTEFQFKVADLNFHSTSYDWLVCGGPRCQFKGHGTINGVGGYSFLLTAVDGELPGGGGEDKFRMKIWITLTGQVVYDNQRGDDDFADPTTAIGGGSIVIHKG